MSSTKSRYQTEAENLHSNQSQWDAYKSTGHCVVLAGPGSGKTKVLTMKMARLLAEDIRPPRGVACITYSNQCAKELKKRLEVLGIDETAQVFIGTVHSFCLQHVVKPYAKLAGLDVACSLNVATQNEQKSLFEKAAALVVPDRNPARIRTEFDKFRRTVFDRDSVAWNEDKDMSSLVLKYEQLLHQKNKIDFDEMVLNALNLIQRYNWVRKILKAKFPILVIDEYQDLGIPLHAIVLSLCIKEGVRLFAVADPDQSIYGFTGAKPSLLKDLEHIDNVEIIRLRMNYRCGQEIITGSTAALAISRNYQAVSDHEGLVFEHPIPEGFEAQIAHVINVLIPDILLRKNNRQLGDIAFLYKDRYDGELIAQQLSQSEYKYVRFDQGAPYQRNQLTMWLEECAAWCSGGWMQGKPKLSNLIRAWMFFIPTIKTNSEVLNVRKKLVEFLFNNRSTNCNQSNKMMLHDWIKSFCKFQLHEWLQQEPAMRDDFDVLKKMYYDSKNPEHPLSLYSIETLGNQRGAPDHLNLTTYHSAKGLEYDVVIIPGLDQGWMPDSRNNLQEERRIFYVAMTRARHEVHFLWSGWRERNPRVNGRSQFVEEVMKKLGEFR